MAASEAIQVGPLSVRFLVEAAQSGGSVAMFEITIPADARVPAPHSHDGYEETIYGLTGTSTWTVDGESTEIGPGDVVCIPRGAVHGFDNRGDVDAAALAVVTPGLLGPDYFREVGAVLATAGASSPDFAALSEVMSRHGLTPARPTR
jgi:quercetin dioxygenase-like cupin family protein